MSARKEEIVMADADEPLASRVARIELDVAHLGSNVALMQVDFRELRKEMGEGFKDVTTRIDTFYTRMDEKLEASRTRLDGRIDALDRKLDAFHSGLGGRIDALDNRIDALDAKGTKHFLWLLSTMVALSLAVAGALAQVLLTH